MNICGISSLSSLSCNKDLTQSKQGYPQRIYLQTSAWGHHSVYPGFTFWSMSGLRFVWVLPPWNILSCVCSTKRTDATGRTHATHAESELPWIRLLLERIAHLFRKTRLSKLFAPFQMTKDYLKGIAWSLNGRWNHASASKKLAIARNSFHKW